MATGEAAVRPLMGADELLRPPVLEPRAHAGIGTDETQVVEAVGDRAVGMGVDVADAPVRLDAIDGRDMAVRVINHGAGPDRFRIDRWRIEIWSVGLFQREKEAERDRRNKVTDLGPDLVSAFRAARDG